MVSTRRTRGPKSSDGRPRDHKPGPYGVSILKTLILYTVVYAVITGTGVQNIPCIKYYTGICPVSIRDYIIVNYSFYSCSIRKPVGREYS